MKHDTREFIHWFRQAGPYINAHRGRTFVIAFGGEAVTSPGFAHLVQDIALLHSLGVRIVIVHGARPQIDARLAEAELSPHLHRGLRVTSQAELPAVKQAVAALQLEIQAQFSMALPNTPMCGAGLGLVSGNFVMARPYGIHDGVDFQHTGNVRKVNAEAIERQLAGGSLVLVSNMGFSATGELFNLRAEEVATATAGALGADKLIFLTRMASELPAKLNPAEAQQLLVQPDADAELAEHLQSAVAACGRGVARVHLVDREEDGALLRELYTRDGSGTLVTSESYDTLRQASIEDVGGILELITPLEQAGVLVRRSREQLELEIDRFQVLLRDDMIIATAALYPFVDEAVGELACLAVHPDYRDQGIGAQLLEGIESHARALGLDRLLVLTTQTAHWFQERGFVAGDVSDLPAARQALYNYQRNSRVFIKSLVKR